MPNIAHMIIIWFAAAMATVTATIRRLLLGPTLPSWSWMTEWTVASARAVIGVAARYRDDQFLYRVGRLLRMPVRLSLRGKVRVRSVRIGPVAADRYELSNRPEPATLLLYFHGGGYAFGNPGTHREFIARLVDATGTKALAPRYRLAPKNRYPAAVDDAQAAYEAVLARGTAPENIVLAGDSAGGGLALALLHRIRTLGLPMPSGTILISPYTNLEHTEYTIRTNARTDYLPLSELSHPNDWYANEDQLTNPEVSPAFADLTGFPPMLILAGGAEMVLGDSITLKEHADRDGVDAQLVVFPEMMHVWPIMVSWEPASQQALDACNDWLNELG